MDIALDTRIEEFGASNLWKFISSNNIKFYFIFTTYYVSLVNYLYSLKSWKTFATPIYVITKRSIVTIAFLFTFQTIRPIWARVGTYLPLKYTNL